jgi:hypothetical protein
VLFFSCQKKRSAYNAHPLTQRQRKADDSNVSEQDQKILKKGLDE